jgi:hypothetical protein
MAVRWSLNPTSPIYGCNPGLSQLRLYLLHTSSFSSGDFFVAAQGRLDVFKETTRWVSSWLGAAPQEEEEEEEEEERRWDIAWAPELLPLIAAVMRAPASSAPLYQSWYSPFAFEVFVGLRTGVLLGFSELRGLRGLAFELRGFEHWVVMADGCWCSSCEKALLTICIR